MKSQSFQVRAIQNQIAACLRLITAKVKSAILRLIDLESQLEAAMNQQLLSPEQEYLAAIQEKKQANQENKNGEFFWGFSAETAENKVVELCQKHKCQPSRKLLEIAVNSINSGSKCSVWTLERNVKRALEHWERMAQWEKEAEAQWVEAEKEHDNNPITKIIAEIEGNGFSANLWEKYGKVRIYVYDCFGTDCGYVDCTNAGNIKDMTNTDGIVGSIIKNLGGLKNAISKEGVY